MARKNTEDAIQKEFIRWSRLTYPDIAVIGTRNEDSYKRSEEIEAGLPDILGRVTDPKDGIRHIIYFEIKTLKGTLLPSQIEWAAKPRCSNEHYGIGYGLKDCREVWTALIKSTGIDLIVRDIK